MKKQSEIKLVDPLNKQQREAHEKVMAHLNSPEGQKEVEALVAKLIADEEERVASGIEPEEPDNQPSLNTKIRR